MRVVRGVQEEVTVKNGHDFKGWCAAGILILFEIFRVVSLDSSMTQALKQNMSVKIVTVTRQTSKTQQ